MAARTQRLLVAPTYRSPMLARRSRRLLISSTVTIFTALLLLAYLSPLLYGLRIGLSDPHTALAYDAPTLYPSQVKTFHYQGQNYVMHQVPVDGELRELALFKPGRKSSIFLDPQRPDQPITWMGSYRGLEHVWTLHLSLTTVGEVARGLKVCEALRNTLIIGITSTLLTLVSATLVAYGLACFAIPGRRLLFFLLLATMILPAQITLVPVFVLFTKIGWTNTQLPLIIPHFFTSATSVFLLRQIFVSIPAEMQEAALVDGAGPVRTLRSIMLPQARWGLLAVAVLHFVRSAQDFMGPLLYLVDRRDLQPLAARLYYHYCGSGNDLHFYSIATLGAVIAIAFFLVFQRVIMRAVVAASPHNVMTSLALYWRREKA